MSEHSPFPRPSPKLIRLRLRRALHPVEGISQQDLRTAELLCKQLGIAQKSYARHMQFLEKAWRAGASVEPGDLAIEDIMRRGGGVYIDKWEKLGIRVVRKKHG